LVVLLMRPAYAAGGQPYPSFSGLGGELADDSRWFVNSIQLDIEDVATSPLYVAAPESPLRSPRFYLALTAGAAVWGTSFALDKTIQSGVGHMSHAAHDVMENLSYTMLITAAGGTLIYGLYADDIPARRDPLTGLEAAGLAVGFNELVERATGRRRPYQTRGSTAFFAGGRSFTSGDVVIESALATGVSTYYDNAWYVASPSTRWCCSRVSPSSATIRNGSRTWSAAACSDSPRPKGSSGCISARRSNPTAGGFFRSQPPSLRPVPK
jgi:hypothetical protein